MEQRLSILAAVVALALPILSHAAPPESNDPAVRTATKELIATMNTRATIKNMLAQIERQMRSSAQIAEAAALVRRTNLTPERKAEAYEVKHTR